MDFYFIFIFCVPTAVFHSVSHPACLKVLKTQMWVLPFHSTIVSETRQEYVANVIWANLFRLFRGKEQSNMPQGAEIQSKIVWFKYWLSINMKHKDENCTFSWFSDQLFSLVLLKFLFTHRVLLDCLSFLYIIYICLHLIYLLVLFEKIEQWSRATEMYLLGRLRLNALILYLMHLFL